MGGVLFVNSAESDKPVLAGFKQTEGGTCLDEGVESTGDNQVAVFPTIQVVRLVSGPK